MSTVTARRSPPTRRPTRSRSEPFRFLTPEIPEMDAIFRDRHVLGEAGEAIPLDVFVPEAEGRLLYSLVRWLRPEHTLEVGLANGISAAYIARGLCDNDRGQHLAIDPFQSSRWQRAGLVTLRRAGVEQRVSLDQRDSQLALPQWHSRGHRVQFAFIDGSHLFEYVLSDFLHVDRMLDVGGLIALDDSDWPAISAVLRFVLANRHYEIVDTGVVIEPSRLRPSIAARLLRIGCRLLPAFGERVRPDVVAPDHVRGIRGRCVVLRKRAEDDRNNQSRHFVRF